MTTQELVERLREISLWGRDVQGAEDDLRAAASRLSEMEDTLKRLRKQLSETMMDIAIYEDVGVIRARAMERRAALEHQQKGEKL